MSKPERDYSQEYKDRTGVSLGHLAEEAGLDTSVCEFCSKALDDKKPWVRGLDGMGAHEECLPRWD